jgi:Type VI secretion system/phage-baseplate injector OB domain
MPNTLYESPSSLEKKDEKSPSIVSGVVTNNCDLIMQGKVLVRIPSLNQEVWARLTSSGGGSGVGEFAVPPADAEVLVAMCGDAPQDAYILGGLWGTRDRPPISLPTDMQTKRLIKTGLTPATGHLLEFDDALQSVTITTSTQQTVTLDPTKIELKTSLGTVKLTLDLAQQSISIQALAPPPLGVIELKATKISLQAAEIEIGNMLTTAKTTVQGATVMIN